MYEQPLHPNLARLAASYNLIGQRFSRGEIDAAEAHREISTLDARDDEGVHWRIDPRDGQWIRYSLAGEWVHDTPPSYGFATPTPHDLTAGGRGVNPDAFISHQQVDEATLHAADSLVGSTRRRGDAGDGFAGLIGRYLGDTRSRLVAAAAVVVVIFLAMHILGGSPAKAPEPTTTTVATTTTAPAPLLVPAPAPAPAG